MVTVIIALDQFYKPQSPHKIGLTEIRDFVLRNFHSYRGANLEECAQNQYKVRENFNGKMRAWSHNIIDKMNI